MKKIVIMGAGGFVGTNLTEYLRKRYEVRPITRKDFDLLDWHAAEDFLKRERPDVIINCTNQGGSRKTEATGAAADVIGNNLKMFFAQERCLETGMKMINFGIGAQYNKSRDLCKVREEEFGTVIPADDYGYSKYVMEQYIRERSLAGAQGVIYNPIIFGLYGAHEDYSFKFISNAILKNMLGMPITINQNVVFDYLYLDDFLRIIEHIIENDCTYKEFNITPTESINLVHIAELINNCGRYQSEIIVKNPGMNYQYTGDNGRLLANMGADYRFTSYQEGIERLYQYYEAHRSELDMETIRQDSLMKLCKTRKKQIKEETGYVREEKNQYYGTLLQ